MKQQNVHYRVQAFIHSFVQIPNWVYNKLFWDIFMDDGFYVNADHVNWQADQWGSSLPENFLLYEQSSMSELLQEKLSFLPLKESSWLNTFKY